VMVNPKERAVGPLQSKCSTFVPAGVSRRCDERCHRRCQPCSIIPPIRIESTASTTIRRVQSGEALERPGSTFSCMIRPSVSRARRIEPAGRNADNTGSV
jgi:hypothetical protein